MFCIFVFYFFHKFYTVAKPLDVMPVDSMEQSTDIAGATLA
jgi:hypothetical protein